MATLTELRELFNDSGLLNKIESAVIIAANTLITGAESANDRAWVAAAFSNPKAEAKKALMAVLAENAGNTVAQIQGASDVAIQANINTVVPVLVAAKAGV